MFAMQRMQRAAAPALRTARRNMSGHSAEEAKAETLAWKKYSASMCFLFLLVLLHLHMLTYYITLCSICTAHRLYRR